MKLVIRSGDRARLGDDCIYYLEPGMLKMKAVHMFIAKNPWESITVELSDDIPQGAMRFFPTICENIKVFSFTELTETNLRQLCELYPDKGGKLRRLYFAGGNALEVIQECLV